MPLWGSHFGFWTRNAAPRFAGGARRLLATGFLALLTALPARAFDYSFYRFSLEDGLSNTIVYAMHQDRRGFMWFGTQDGLNRYDGYRFKVFRNDPDDPRSIADNYVYSIVEDSRGRFWVGTNGGGVNRYDRAANVFIRHQHDPDDPYSLSHNAIGAIVEDGDGLLWIATLGGGLNRLDPETGRFTAYRHDPNDPASLSDDMVWSLCLDRDGDLWVGTVRGGLNRFDPATGAFQRYAHSGPDPGSLTGSDLWFIRQDRDGQLWTSSSQGGLHRFDPDTGRFTRNALGLGVDEIRAMVIDRDGQFWLGAAQDGLILRRADGEIARFLNDPADKLSLSYNKIQSVYEDREGNIWLGLYGGGLNRINPASAQFTHYKTRSASGSLTDNDVHGIAETPSGGLWIAAKNGLNWLSADQRGRSGRDATFTRLRHDPENPNSLAENETTAVALGRGNAVWVGLEGKGLNRIEWNEADPGQYRVTRFVHDPEDSHSLSNNGVNALLRDSRGRMWIGAMLGLNRYEPALRTESGRTREGFLRFFRDAARPDSLSDNRVTCLAEDRAGRLYVGGRSGGLNCLEPDQAEDPTTARFTRYRADPDDPHSLTSDVVWAVYEDSRGVLWVGGAGGLNRGDRVDGGKLRFTAYRERDGLPNDTVYGILEDRRGRLWLSGNHGLNRFDPLDETFRNYDVHDGLQSNEFTRGSYAAGEDGRLYFGGVNGVSAFYPDRIARAAAAPQAVIVDFTLFHESMGPRGPTHPDSPLARSVEESDAVTLDHTQYFFTFEFAALQYADPEHIRYAYRLDNLDPDWIYTDADKRFAPYANLSPGDYRFRVKAANRNGAWSEREAVIAVRVLPPPWRTWQAYSLYALLLAAAIVLYLRRQHHKLARERAVVDQLREADRVKDRFIANLSHELRTPLNGIIGLAESLRREEAARIQPRGREDLTLIARSGRRLTHLVNNLLDFAKAEKNALRLRTETVDLHRLTEQVFDLCRADADEKGLTLRNAVPVRTAQVRGDRQHLRQTLYNLVDNGVKFTDSGSVSVFVERDGGRLAVGVADTGPGVAEDRRAQIFESFEQGDSSAVRLHSGAGLGLSVARDLAALHGGALSLAANPGGGSVFRFSAPAAEAAPPETDSPPTAEAKSTSAAPTDAAKTASDKPHVQIVDDDRINRRVVRRFLERANFRLTEAENGPQALRQLQQDPSIDVVLLDVMMPRMSGYEVCRELRKTFANRKLPVIFITAKTGAEDESEGYAAGGNDFLTKPLDRAVLLDRVYEQLANARH